MKKESNPSERSFPSPISAVIITKNEAHNIARCLDSLTGLVEEIIVVDSYSTDRTEAICLEKGARFVKKNWEGYAESKNFGNELATHDYILSVDADEAISEELRSSILKLKSSLNADAYKMNRLSYYCGKWIWHGNWYPDTKLRIWNKQKGKWVGRLHEYVQMAEGAKIEKLEGNLLHFSFHSISDHVRQMDYLTNIAAEVYLEKGKKASWLKLLINPFYDFIKSFILKSGFRSGYYGFLIALIDAHFTFIKYAKLKELRKQEKLKKSTQTKRNG